MEKTQTIGGLEASGGRLGLLCRACSRFRYMNSRRYKPDEIVREIAKTLTCARCSSETVETFAVQRDEKTGFWPAEHG
ncbi:hypothetical protein GCM10011316_33730 [Roseibium aquae]|uniref:Uncharacterized protein n=1 Tax=Roseibium aquae TaxID=1323746 RepID=A0A916X1S3_9HYPH|nr:hypothetical protein [Roseibium aquae]GGB58936.1 hypothetical protein GCM10011316_33730 [Roseibium aquae]